MFEKDNERLQRGLPHQPVAVNKCLSQSHERISITKLSQVILYIYMSHVKIAERKTRHGLPQHTTYSETPF